MPLMADCAVYSLKDFVNNSKKIIKFVATRRRLRRLGPDVEKDAPPIFILDWCHWLGNLLDEIAYIAR